jgi:hypothetical protein
MMSEIDRITELLLSEQEMPDVYRSLMENASNTEPTLDPNSLEALIANQQDQLETRAQIAAMVLGPGKFLGPGKGAANFVKNLAAPYAKSSKNIQPVRKILRGGGDDFFIPPLTQTGRRISGGGSRGGGPPPPVASRGGDDFFIPPLTQTGRRVSGGGSRNVGMQRFMLPANEIARTATTRSGAPKLTEEALKRGDDFFIPPLTQTGRRITRNPYPSPRPNPVSQPIYKQLGISDKAMNIMAGGIAGLSAYTTAGLIYDRLDEETKTQLKKLLQISTEPTE